MTKSNNVNDRVKAKYGVENAAQLDSVKEKIKKTTLEKYGVDNIGKSPKLQKKRVEVNKAKYNGHGSAPSAVIKAIKAEDYEKIDEYWALPHIIGMMETVDRNAIAKYFNCGESSIRRELDLFHGGMKYRDFDKEQMKRDYQAFQEYKKTIPEDYVHVPYINPVFAPKKAMTEEEIQKKREDAFIKKYGVKNPMQAKEVIENRAKVNLKKYRQRGHSFIIENAPNQEIADEWRYFPQVLPYMKPKTLGEWAKYFGASTQSIRLRFENEDLSRDYIIYVSSQKERDFKQFIKDNVTNANYREHDRTQIWPQELDFYFPDAQLAVEISPTSSHNSLTHFAHDDEAPIPGYHKDKFLKCANKGIDLITIFDWTPWNKVLEMIANKLNNNDHRIFARKTRYIEHTHINKDLFEKLSSWHILSLPQNFKRDNYVSELQVNNETVGLALWSRHPKYDMELKRMVFKPGISVVGGPSKLVNNFIKNHTDINNIMTYSDCDLGRGQVYGAIGFTMIEQSSPSLNYYNEYYDWHIKSFSLVRQGANRLLSKFPNYKPVGKGPNKPSNKEIVLSYNFLPVYDCGNRKWVMDIQR